ncbi:MAG: hypothetical protein D6744_13560 [Planctomycetota bacterium]|nr:MAG: hypothetical protein D6744_13560 [Planctomycetota bacterium]
MTKQVRSIRPLAVEDLRIGDFVTITHELVESMPLCFIDDSATTQKPKRVWLMPATAGRPLVVREVCLPFVFVETSKGKFRTLDVRRHRLARVSKKYARAVFDAVKRSEPSTDGDPSA